VWHHGLFHLANLPRLRQPVGGNDRSGHRLDLHQFWPQSKLPATFHYQTLYKNEEKWDTDDSDCTDLHGFFIDLFLYQY
jgi:hypothetical protein